MKHDFHINLLLIIGLCFSCSKKREHHLRMTYYDFINPMKEYCHCEPFSQKPIIPFAIFPNGHYRLCIDSTTIEHSAFIFPDYILSSENRPDNTSSSKCMIDGTLVFIDNHRFLMKNVNPNFVPEIPEKIRESYEAGMSNKFDLESNLKTFVYSTRGYYCYNSERNKGYLFCNNDGLNHYIIEFYFSQNSIFFSEVASIRTKDVVRENLQYFLDTSITPKLLLNDKGINRITEINQDSLWIRSYIFQRDSSKTIINMDTVILDSRNSSTIKTW